VTIDRAPDERPTPDEAEASDEREPTEGDPAPSGVEESAGEDPGDRSGDAEPHHALSNPANEPDPTEWPDPYERRDDPRDPPDPDAEPFGEEPHAPTGAESTSEPHPSHDPESPDWEGPKRDKLDE
jgi:hypothetical protein